MDIRLPILALSRDRGSHVSVIITEAPLVGLCVLLDRPSLARAFQGLKGSHTYMACRSASRYPNVRCSEWLEALVITAGTAVAKRLKTERVAILGKVAVDRFILKASP